MNCADIPRPEWRGFLQSFLHRHRDGLVNVRIESEVSADCADARERSLSELDVHEEAGGTAFAVRTRDHRGRRAAHRVDGVTRLRLLQNELGVEVALFAESDTSRILVHFVLALPGATDCIDAMPDSPGSDA